MGDPSGVSRRGLFSLGLSRVVGEPDSEPSAPPPGSPDALETAAYEERLSEAWSDGDGADLWAEAAGVLLEAAPCGPGDRVLDAGAGDGNVALLAADRGAVVTACDAAGALVARGRERTAAAGAAIDWLDADMAELPFEDGAFDCALSAFAPMFCLRAPSAIGELFRVVRPGGTVAFTTWGVSGVVGRLLRLADERDPSPARVPNPLTWGREERVRTELDCHTDRADWEYVRLSMSFATRAEATERLVRALGPVAAAAELDESLPQAARAIVDELVSYHHGHVRLSSKYLVAVARRP